MIRERRRCVAAQWAAHACQSARRLARRILPAGRAVPARLVRLARLLGWQDCLLCRGHSRGRLLCGFCRHALPRLAASANLARLARHCGLDALAVRHDFREPLRGLVVRFKYHGELALAAELAGLLPRPPRQAGPLVLLPVPPDPLRLRERGHDHVALLAAAYAGRHALDQARARRTRALPAQAGLGRRQRAANLAGAFQVAPAAAGRRVLLLDDVVTTGATLRELAAAARSAGAAWVGAVVLARTPGRAELAPES